MKYMALIVHLLVTWIMSK